MKPMPGHGTYARWQRGCRCDACRQGRTDYQRAYRKRGADRWVNARLGTAVRGLGWPR